MRAELQALHVPPPKPPSDDFFEATREILIAATKKGNTQLELRIDGLQCEYFALNQWPESRVHVVKDFDTLPVMEDVVERFKDILPDPYRGVCGTELFFFFDWSQQ